MEGGDRMADKPLRPLAEGELSIDQVKEQLVEHKQTIAEIVRLAADADALIAFTLVVPEIKT